MQADPLQINKGYPRDGRFLLKRLRVIRVPFHVDTPSQKMPFKDFTP